MIRNIFIGIILILCSGCTNKDFIFDRVHELISNEKYLESIIVIDSIKSENKDNKSIEFEAICLKGIVYYHLQEFDKAKVLLKEGLQFDESKKPLNNLFLHHNDFELTKNLAGRTLTEIYIRENNYNDALKILNLINGKYGEFICGTYYLESENYINNKFAECYLHLDSLEVATFFLQRNLFLISEFISPEVYPLFLEKMKAKYNNHQLDSLAKSAIINLNIEDKIEFEEKISSCYTSFLNLKIEIADESSCLYLNEKIDIVEFDTLTDENISQSMLNECRKYIENSRLYRDMTNEE